MKRFAAALLAISLVLGLSACSSPSPELQEFTDGVHERDEVYPAHIETKSVALGGLGIHFSTSAFDETASRMRSLRIWRLTRGRTSSRWRPSISRRTSRTRRPSPWRPTAPSPWRPMSSARPGRRPFAAAARNISQAGSRASALRWRRMGCKRSWSWTGRRTCTIPPSSPAVYLPSVPCRRSG